MIDTTLFDNFRSEIQLAESSRKRGNEGLARVCSRRALGYIIEEYFQIQGDNYKTQSAYDRIKYFLKKSTESDEINNSVSYFLMRINNQRHLPENIDLIFEAKWLAYKLIGWYIE